MAVLISALLIAVAIYRMTRPQGWKRVEAKERKGKEMGAVLCNLRRCYPSKTEAWRWEEAKRIMKRRGSKTPWR